jgi:hypothetical protein
VPGGGEVFGVASLRVLVDAEAGDGVFDVASLPEAIALFYLFLYL